MPVTLNGQVLVGITWRFLHSRAWCLGWDDSGLDLAGPTDQRLHMVQHALCRKYRHTSYWYTEWEPHGLLWTSCILFLRHLEIGPAHLRGSLAG